MADAFLWILVLSALVLGALAVWRHDRLKGRVREQGRAIKRLQIELLRTRQRQAAREAGERLREAGRPPALTLEFTSEYGEDVFLWELFEGALQGRYVEVGAFDGRTFSVTWPFESLGWTGVLIEAIPERCEACRAARPNSTVVHAALVSEASAKATPEVEFTVVGAGEGVAAEMLSFRSTNEEHRRLLDERRHQTRRVTVPARTMDDVLATGVGSGPIDFAVLDVEGGEPELLAGFDLARWGVRVLVVEDLAKGRDATVPDLMRSRGYERATRVGLSDVYIRSDERELLERAHALVRVLH